MKFASIGIPAASRSRRDGRKRQAGFTLLEALVALALILAFAAALPLVAYGLAGFRVGYLGVSQLGLARHPFAGA